MNRKSVVGYIIEYTLVINVLIQKSLYSQCEIKTFLQSESMRGYERCINKKTGVGRATKRAKKRQTRIEESEIKHT